MNTDGLAGTGIPYLSMIKKAMPKETTSKKKKFKDRKLTEIDPKTKKPCLKKGISTERAVEVLYMFESTDVTPKQIEDMKTTIGNLMDRIKKLEEWQ